MTADGGSFFFPIRQTSRNRPEHFGQVATQKAMLPILLRIGAGERPELYFQTQCPEAIRRSAWLRDRRWGNRGGRDSRLNPETQ